MKKGHTVIAMGILIFSISVLLSHAFGISSTIIDIIMGLGCGVEIVGIIMLIVENRKEKRSQ